MMTWTRSILWSAAATLVAMALMFWGRAAFQVRTLPERMMEWLLLFVPLDQFEQGIRTFGPKAKVYGLYGGTVVMTLALIAIGALLLRRRLPGFAILGAGLLLYVVAMAGLMPLTGGGFFGRDLFQNIYLVNGLYLGVALAHATVLLAGRVFGELASGVAGSGSALASRRALLVGATGTLGAYAVALRQVATGRTGVVSALPLAELPPSLSAGATPPGQPASAATATVHPGLADAPSILTPQIIAQATAAGNVVLQATATDAARVPTEVSTSALTPAPPTQPPPTAVPPTVVPTGAPPLEAATQPPALTAPPPTQAPPTAEPPTALLPTSIPPTAVPPTVPPVPTATQDTSPLPTPAPARVLERDKDGALTAASRAKGELAALVTPSGAHYVVTKNPVADPQLDVEGWRLIIDGEVNRPVQLDYRTLRRLPAVELYKTLECISNFTSMCELTYFGCDLMSTAKWTGARLRDVLELAGGLRSGVVSLQVQGADEYSSSIPAALASDPDALLVYEMNGQVLPRQHGYPVRLLVPGRYGMKNAKWVVGIRAMRTEFVDWYGQRNWSRTGIVKTMSRIDVPYNTQKVQPGRNRIAGIAYAGDRGVSSVQFSSNGGQTWNPTLFLEPPLGRDTWVRWQAEFDIAPGQKLTLTSRAVDGQGAAQTNVFNLPQPDGGSGYHSIEVNA